MTDEIEEEPLIEHEFCFDIKGLHKRLDDQDEWSLVIQGHLYLDHVLTRILEDELKRPEKVALDRMSFSTKLDLAIALGLLDVEEAAIRRINSIRNSIAHDLNFVVTEMHAKEMRDLSPVHARQLIDEQASLGKSLLRSTLMVNVIFLDLKRHSWMEYRARRNAAFANARRVLENTKPGRIPSSAVID